MGNYDKGSLIDSQLSPVLQQYSPPAAGYTIDTVSNQLYYWFCHGRLCMLLPFS